MTERQAKRKPKFRVRQVVCLKINSTFLKIAGRDYSYDSSGSGWMYRFRGWDKDQWDYERNLRALTLREAGPRKGGEG